MLETWHHGHLNTNGIRLHYVTQGEGPLLLLLHGFPQFWYCWRHQIPEFAKDHQVVALDLRGYNESDKPADSTAYAVPELVADIKGVISALGHDRCTLIGHDWGGAIAWHFAYTYPEMLRQLVVLNMPHLAKFSQGLQTPQQLLRSWYIFFFQLPSLPEWFLTVSDYWVIDRILSGMAVRPDAFTLADLKRYKEALSKPGAVTAIVNYYRNILGSGRLERQLGVLDVPTLMIWGEEDMALGKELTYGTEAYVRDLQLHYVPNCSHWVQEEQPEIVNTHIRNFLQPIA